MNEKVLLQSEQYNIKKIAVIILAIGFLLSLLLLIFTWSGNNAYYTKLFYAEEIPYDLRCNCDFDFCTAVDGYLWDTNDDEMSVLEKVHPTLSSYVDCAKIEVITGIEILLCCIPLIATLIFSMFFYFGLYRDQIIITDKRVYGKTIFGKRVDLPLDSVSAVGTSWLKSIYVGTSSGRIVFSLIKNQEEIHSLMSNLLLERQQKETKNTIVENIMQISNADEIKKFKDLLDSGVITQEEFDAKKKQLLGL